jgi:hypothetical protein
MTGSRYFQLHRLSITYRDFTGTHVMRDSRPQYASHRPTVRLKHYSLAQLEDNFKDLLAISSRSFSSALRPHCDHCTSRGMGGVAVSGAVTIHRIDSIL